MTLTVARREFLIDRLEKTSAVMIREFLTYRQLDTPKSGSFAPQINKLLAYVDSGTLTESDVERFLLDFYESNAKRVMVYDCNASSDQGKVLSQLPNLRTAPSINDLKLSATKSTLCYSELTKEYARVTWVEQHLKLRVGSDGDSVQKTPTKKVIVAHLDRTKQRLYLMLDNPNRHSHGSRVDEYYEYYEMQAALLFSVGLTPVQLEGWVTALEKNDACTLARIDATGSDTSFRFSVKRTGTNLLNTKDYTGPRAAVSSRRASGFLWLVGKKSPKSSVKPLVRTVLTNVDCRASMIQFGQHTLRNEIEYVLAFLP